MKKIAATIMILTAGSIFCNNIPASAKGVELDRVDITFKRDHDYDRYERHERPEHHEMRHNEPPPPQAHQRNGEPGMRRGFEDPHHARGFEHMPPPPPPHHHHHRGSR